MKVVVPSRSSNVVLLRLSGTHIHNMSSGSVTKISWTLGFHLSRIGDGFMHPTAVVPFGQRRLLSSCGRDTGINVSALCQRR